MSFARRGRVFERTGPGATRIARSVAAVLALAAAGWPAALSAQSPHATEVRVVAPFGPGGLVSALAVSARASGACWTASLASASRPDAWRCTSGNRIHDPCFAGFAGGDQLVACLPSPWSADAVVLSLAAPLPGDVSRPKDLLDGPPWALELASGERCTMLTGATWGVAGMRVNYGCPEGVSVVGDLDRRGPTWRAFVHRAGTAVMGQVEIRAAYY
jgi:hypothetical protein